MIPKILGLFVKTFNGGHKYSVLYRKSLKEPIQMQLSQKQNLFCQFVSAFLKSILNFEHFQKKMTLIADLFPKLQTPKNVAKQMSKKSHFREPFDKQHGKEGQTIFKNINVFINHCEGN